MPSAAPTNTMQLSLDNHLASGTFTAMASPCQLLLDTDNWQLASALLLSAVTEAQRIQAKFSRYTINSIVSAINNSNGNWVAIDAETERLLTYADTLYTVSDGLFDVTSGVLRTVWCFEPGSVPPNHAQLQAVLSHIGWPKVQRKPQHVVMPAGMQIDFGGIGKEYAVDQIARLIEQQAPSLAYVINMGGDLRCKGPRQCGSLWQVGIEDPLHDGQSLFTLKVGTAAIATSGDSKRYIMHKGQRYSHLLNPLTGYPVTPLARAVTVQAESCLTAGMLSSITLLQGADAADFLRQQQHIQAWLVTEHKAKLTVRQFPST